MKWNGMEWISASPKNMGSNKPGAQIISLNEMEWNGSASPKNMGSNKPGAQIISLNEME